MQPEAFGVQAAGPGSAEPLLPDPTPRPRQRWKMMPSFLTVFTMPDTSCPGRGLCQGVWACAALVMVWVSVLLPTPRATAHATATALGATVVEARARTDMGSSVQQPRAQRREGARQRGWSMADIQADHTTASPGDAALETQLQRSLQVI